MVNGLMAEREAAGSARSSSNLNNLGPDMFMLGQLALSQTEAEILTDSRLATSDLSSNDIRGRFVADRVSFLSAGSSINNPAQSVLDQQQHTSTE